jgi:hypothetical protein
MTEFSNKPVGEHTTKPAVMRLADVDQHQVRALLARFGLSLVIEADNAAISGSYWGDDEAGLIAERLYARADTPLHSILHEACHWITCTPERRAQLHTDAADTQDEENATCYLQILLADELTDFGRTRALIDMDAWGYSFRLGSARAWFEQDAAYERQWLIDRGLIDANERSTFGLR